MNTGEFNQLEFNQETIEVAAPPIGPPKFTIEKLNLNPLTCLSGVSNV